MMQTALPWHRYNSFSLVDLLQALAKGMGSYADNGIGLRVEIVTPPQRFGRDHVFRDLIILILEGLLADKSVQLGEVAGSAQCRRGQQPVQLFLFGLKPVRGHLRQHTKSPI
jgi:hypothetical protein